MKADDRNPFAAAWDSMTAEECIKIHEHARLHEEARAVFYPPRRARTALPLILALGVRS